MVPTQTAKFPSIPMFIAFGINALANKWLQTDKMNILLVGDKVKIFPGLKKFGYEIIELDVDGNRK
jgi:zinc protease